MNKKIKPLFIIGYPRSGTTLLLYILRSTGEYPIYDFDETHFFSHFYFRYGKLNKAAQQDRFLSDLTSSTWFKSSGLSKKEFFSSLSKEVLSYQSVLSTFMELIAVKQGKERWLEKTPWHLLYINEIARFFPEAKFIFLTRDPRSVVQSVTTAGWISTKRGGGLRVAASWRWHNLHACRELQKYKNRYITLKYEDIILNTTSIFRKLSEFLCINFDIDSIKYDPKINTLAKSNSSYNEDITGLSDIPLLRWKKDMELGSIKTIEAVVGSDCMKKFGYDPYLAEKISFPYRMMHRYINRFYSLSKIARLKLFPLVRR